LALSTRTAASLACGALLLCLAAAPVPPADDSATGEAPVDLAALLKNLGEKAKVYADVALKFVCLESVHSSESPQDEKTYDYMYIGAQQQRYLPYRQKHTGRLARSVEEASLNINFPDSYSWTLMFLPERQHLFHFKYVGQEWYSLRLCHILEFTASLPYTAGQTIYEWSGKVWIDAENYNFIRVEAQPGGQQERLKLELKGYRQAPRFLVFPIARRPRGAQYNITFLNDFQKLSLPDQAEYRVFEVDLDDSRELQNVTTLRYKAYQFFDINVKDKFLK
jgi:hypothetical protein